MKKLLLAAAALSPLMSVSAQEAKAPALAPSEIVAAAPADAWVAIAPSDLLIMDLSPDATGKPRRVVIQLMPAPFSQGWIGNIRKLAAAHWWDGTSVNRVQDNYVAQWGDATEKKALPEGLAVVPESEYVRPYAPSMFGKIWTIGPPRDAVMAEYPSPPSPRPLASYVDPYVQKFGISGGFGFSGGFPIAATIIQTNDGAYYKRQPETVWPIHCYGAIGVGRNMSPDTGSGAELYAVIGHAPRHLDRNIAVVGRVIKGIEYLSSLPRGTGALGFYEDEKERVAITSIRVATELPTAEQPKYEYLSTDSDSFAHYADARANRRDPFFIKPAGGADICNIPVPVRLVGTK